MKLMIVEDEVAIADLLLHSIEWEAMGFETPDIADNGENALLLYQEKRHDIIISDIEMPIMDGITMLKHLRKEEDMPEIIFLTCHEDFSMLREAMRGGAMDYILKPFQPEVISAAVSKAIIAREEYLKKRGIENEIEQQRKQLADSRDIRLKSFLRVMLNGSYADDTEEISSQIERGHIPLIYQEEHRLLYFGANYHEQKVGLERHNFNFVLKNILCELFVNDLQCPYCIDFYQEPYMSWILIMREETYWGKNYDELIHRFFETVRQYIGVEVSCIISGPVMVSDFFLTKKEMDYRFSHSLANSSRIVRLDEEQETFEGSRVKVQVAEVTRFLQEQKRIEFSIYIKELLRSKGQQPDAGMLQYILQELLQAFYGYMYENHMDIDLLMSDENARKIHDVASYSAANLMKYALFMYDYIQKSRVEAIKNETVVERAKRYMEEHLAEPIGRTEIAESVNLAPNYLSMLFNKETGKTLRDYLNECRIEQAKKLMASSTCSVTDIALQVGYDNIPYFSTVFKKHTGMKPAEYRNSLRNAKE